ncbi:MAG: aspartyl/asparaginyl beta-hydroxylase domain-containing protein [Gammaproteobacteria bacterium]|nr:aspartyl/asparaginyl beta-hydroxylase domain-containing protein [Gammaproteobacteria bacterium]
MSLSDDYVKAGAAALDRGDALGAREQFSKAVAAGRKDGPTLLGLARACELLKDQAGRIAAVDQLLAVEPRHLPALILRGDLFAAVGDTRSASAYYLAALKVAPPAEQLPPGLVRELKRVQQACAAYSEQYKSWIGERMAASGFDAKTSSQRFAQSLDIVLGRKKIYVQEPKYYYFPALPQIQFYEREAFPWLSQLEAATDEIRNELLGVLDQPGTFAPYVQGDSNRPYKAQMGMLNNPAWSAFYLWKNGDPVPENAARCPRTLEVLRDLPLARVPMRSPAILFSLLKPGARIPPHHGLVNTRLICHLPLIVPGRCGFRVGNDVREWEEGKAWVFDDTIEHEAWNDSDQTRVILLFDVWRPELTLEEQGLVTALFDAIDAHSGTKPDWQI